VYTAATGQAGIQMAKAHEPAVITLDVMMANMDGWAVLTALKGDPEVAHIPVVMLTIVDDKNLGYALGASDYITKPVDRGRLVDLLNKYRLEGEYQILLVEDDPATRKMMADLISAQGWEVIEAENGKVALERLSKQKPALILLDLMMPEMDGFEFIETARRHEALRDIPIIVVTAMNLSYEDRLRLDGYIRKIIQKGSYTPETLVQEVRDLIQLTQRKPTQSAAPG